MKVIPGTALATLIAASALSAQAQSRMQTYKCETQGKTTYSDEPCIGAKVVDTTPTQGMDKMTGKSRKGEDVRRIERREMMANAIRPITGLSPEQYAKETSRVHLTPEVKRNCATLDERISDGSTTDEVKLYQYRKKYKDLKC